jgi:uncharacterized protein
LIIDDSIYGRFEVSEPLLVELINSPSVQRLKGIGQFGVPDEFYNRRNFSRYDHSVGTMLILRMHGASLKEQAAGLLHDVSHTAFSHTYDWVMKDHDRPGQKEDMQDARHEDFIRRSELPGILKSHGVKPGEIWDYKPYTLLELDTPDICADRLDYALREAPEVAEEVVPHLGVENGRYIFIDVEAALVFARRFLRLQSEHWGSQEAVTRFNYLAQVLRWALEAGVITHDDFDRDDEYIVSKLKKAEEPLVWQGLDVLRRKKLPTAKNMVKLYKKFRYVDPITKRGRLSEVYPKFREELLAAKEENDQGVMVAPLAELL